MQAGKDVYIEKPISHVYAEGPKIIAAAKKYGRVVQQGSQMRSSPVTEKAGELLKDGHHRRGQGRPRLDGRAARC